MLVVVLLLFGAVPVIVFHTGVLVLMSVLFKDHDAKQSGKENHSQSLKH